MLPRLSEERDLCETTIQTFVLHFRGYTFTFPRDRRVSRYISANDALDDVVRSRESQRVFLETVSSTQASSRRRGKGSILVLRVNCEQARIARFPF